MAPKRKPLSAAVEKSLRAKAEKSRFTYRQLAAVYRRGQGAYLSSGSRNVPIAYQEEFLREAFKAKDMDSFVKDINAGKFFK